MQTCYTSKVKILRITVMIGVIRTDVNVQLLVCARACLKGYLADLVFTQICGHKLLFGGQVYAIHVGEAHWRRCTCQVDLDTLQTLV